ncbi:hypothetical protein HDV06_004403 [Boothiomyces sp. JEL0866]|nr:hypothetical protein HDV06_004403 [Boothiomyces sp. JEL0866]
MTYKEQKTFTKTELSRQAALKKYYQTRKIKFVKDEHFYDGVVLSNFIGYLNLDSVGGNCCVSNNEQYEPESGYKLDYDAHIGYSDHIPFENGVPVNINQKYSFQDFHLFKVDELNTEVIDQDVQSLFVGYDLFKSEYYLENKPKIDQDIEKTREFFLLDQKQYQLDRYYIKWASKFTGFGLFSKILIQSGDVIGYYAGILSDNFDNTDYTWLYPETSINGHCIEVGISALEQGNYLRFANHAGEESNTKRSFIPFNGIYTVVYIAVKDIHPEEEITINYGSDYFTTRIDFDE